MTSNATILHSTIGPDYLRAVMASRYDLDGVSRCTLLRRGFNDVYRVDTSGRARFIARLSGRRRRGEANIDYEAQILLDLERAGLCVGTPLATREGTFWSTISLPEGGRALSLFRYIDGRPISFHHQDGSLLGRALGDIHNLAQDATHSTYTLDLTHLLEQPLTWLLQAPAIDGKIKDAFSKVGDTLRARGANLTQHLTKVICHGDYHSGNAVRIAGKEEVGIFDFDDCGPGYASYDLATFLWSLIIRGNGISLEPQFADIWSGFLAGYRRRRGLTGADLEAIAFFLSVRQIWVTGENASRLDEFGLECLQPSWLERQVQLIEAWSAMSLHEIAPPPNSP